MTASQGYTRKTADYFMNGGTSCKFQTSPVK